jgi:hypothetical protein
MAPELTRWSAFLHTHSADDEIWKQVKESSDPLLARTQQALLDGRSLLALQRFVALREGLSAAAYMGERSAGERKDMAAFEGEWKRMGSVLQGDLKAPSPAAFEGLRPAALRALGEASLAQVRVYYEASLEYGRNTMPDAGLYYLGAARAQQELSMLLRGLAQPTTLPAPAVRPIEAELDAFETELLAAYRPPASIDKHREFIGISAALKEARELSAAGLDHGALLRYLQAAQRFGPLRPDAGRADEAAIAGRLRDVRERLAASGVDHSLARMFVEGAEANLAERSEAGSAIALAIADQVLPRYLAALEPERPRAPRPDPGVTVTLVRWPYT